MTPKQCRTQIQNLLDALLIADLAVDRCIPVVVSSPGGLSRVSWPRLPAGRTSKLFFDDFYTIETYLAWIESRQYSAVLFDGSLLQLTFDFRGQALAGHRLVYIPCPFLIIAEDAELLRTEPILDVIDMYRARGEACLRLRTPIRFDFDPDAADDQHPASHVTLNGQACRIPACGPLSLGYFIELVFRHLYPEIWIVHDFLANTPRQALPRQIVETHEQSIHLNWGSIRDRIA